jgi:hypothetical protein
VKLTTSPPSFAKVKNQNSFISSSAVHLNGMDNGNLIQAIWVMMQCCWVNGFPIFGRIVVPLPLPLHMKAPQSFKMSGTANPVTQCFILEDWDPVQYLCDKLKSHRYKFTLSFWYLSYKYYVAGHFDTVVY